MVNVQNTERKTILLVEDDRALALGAEYALSAEGYEVLHAYTIADAKAKVLERPDLILLDVMLPDGNGFDFCRSLREDENDLPVIFLTAVGDEVNIVQGLEVGADDYVTKPYRVKELLSRIAANLRRYDIHKNVRKADKMTQKFGNHLFNMNEFKLYCGDKAVECTPSELRLLRELILNQGNILSRNVLLERLYDSEGSFIDNNTLSVYMKRLRDKLGADADWIETIRGVGYRFRKNI